MHLIGASLPASGAARRAASQGRIDNASVGKDTPFAIKRIRYKAHSL